MEFQEIIMMVGGVISLINLAMAVYYDVRGNDSKSVKHWVQAIGVALFTGWLV
jgi:hypothetical protein